ncbi:MAG: S8 family serine peptidase [Ardenticatenaceae bacterium]|nr:S8 family serine peptidase [Ardenticatenaceae bacterium]MCB9445267.1 S8 family serine peptidase [Ardenticatenaceae bacterium]
MRKLIIFIATIALIITVFGSVAAQSGTGGTTPLQTASPVSVNGRAKIDTLVQNDLATLGSGEMMTVIVTLNDQQDTRNIPGNGRAAHHKAVINALRGKATVGQRQIIKLLNTRRAQGKVSQFESFWVFNGLSVTATADVINELAARTDVSSITTDNVSIVPVGNPAFNSPENNLAIINAPALLNLGFAGQGVIVASMDSGVDITNPDLAARWRGGSNSWFDPYNQHLTTPADVSGHGTWTMGVMVGGDSGGTLIGVAPQAQWIAVKIFNDSGASSATAIHQGFQWLLDPDGNPNTDDAPQVVNNSWAYGTPGCNLEFQLDLQALLAAEIVPVFAAGNYGPSTSSVSPANYPEAFAVGAVNNSGRIYAYSSRGPSACGEAQTVYPEIVAPGVNINTSDLFGLYYQATGTSLAAPHVSGALALLLSAFPDLTADQQRAALLNTAVDLGAAGPDNNFGYGRIDILAAYQWLTNSSSGPTPTPIPPTATPLPPTATAEPPTATPLPPTPTATAVPPTATSLPPTPTATAVPPTATPLPPTPTATAVPPTATSLPPTPTATAVTSDLIFSNGFETGDFSGWTAVVDTENDLAVTSGAAMVGSKGLAALIDNKTAMYLRDDSPVSEPRYRARFYFDPDSIQMRSGDTHRILAARSSSAEIIYLDFRYSSGAYQVQAGIRTDAGKYVTTTWYTISDAPHAIEFDWQAATSAGANNGYLSLWIDNVLRQTKSGIDNDTTRIEELWLGPLSGIDSTTLGTELFDDFVSKRINPIGL